MLHSEAYWKIKKGEISEDSDPSEINVWDTLPGNEFWSPEILTEGNGNMMWSEVKVAQPCLTLCEPMDDI